LLDLYVKQNDQKMKRKWSSLSDSIDSMIALKLQKSRIGVFCKLHLHSKIWKYFKNGYYDSMNKALETKLQFYCNELVTLKQPDVTQFRVVNQLLMSLFHSPVMDKPGFRILQNRIQELRKQERERDAITQRNYLLMDKKRGVDTESFMNNIYTLPPELFYKVYKYL